MAKAKTVAKRKRTKRRAVDPTGEGKARKGEVEAIAKKENERTTRGKSILLDALKEHLGIVTFACEDTGIPRRTYYNWLRDDPEFKHAVGEVQKRELDFVVRKLHERINSGCPRSIRYYLENKGGNAGFGKATRRVVVHGDKDEEPVQVAGQVNVTGMQEELPEASLKAALCDLVKNNPKILENAG